ncbi:MAG: hypothetical protein OEY81_07825 [Candidatus Bathyarchaeota archaeon]|nr:hypothetical protein [Candidatus Bathyarchaeota archaeon]
MPEKIVYDPKRHVENQKNVGKKPAATAKPEKPAKNPKSTKPTKPEKKNEKIVVNAKAHAEDGADVEPDEPVTQFKAKVNKYVFLRVPKKAWSALPFGLEKPLTARIEGETLVIAVATKNQPEEPRPSA